eukprot:CAMPEP_0119545424 /NCGR_PEP_ID=MMETSP1352-20130426/174_1 /TAXON_ID=265584 /ORGANISM="Stauroneis constricta, Strain CCMP1120" /LENGTH=161 /DNA_ID=CAMNT_0007589965 /DNA_START=9 /DNA_END=494 /DNA_ORIENTATION=-
MRSAPLLTTAQQFLGIDVMRTRSTESTEDTSAFRTPIKTAAPTSPSTTPLPSPSSTSRSRRPLQHCGRRNYEDFLLDDEEHELRVTAPIQSIASMMSFSSSTSQDTSVVMMGNSNLSWRTKETMGSIFRSPSQPVEDIPDMFTIQRSYAFDEGSDSELDEE